MARAAERSVKTTGLVATCRRGSCWHLSGFGGLCGALLATLRRTQRTGCVWSVEEAAVSMHRDLQCAVCVYVCMHACMHVCMYVCMYGWMDVRMYVCTHVCMYACMHACMYMCMYAERKCKWKLSQTWEFRLSRTIKAKG